MEEEESFRGQSPVIVDLDVFSCHCLSNSIHLIHIPDILLLILPPPPPSTAPLMSFQPLAPLLPSQPHISYPQKNSDSISYYNGNCFYRYLSIKTTDRQMDRQTDKQTNRYMGFWLKPLLNKKNNNDARSNKVGLN